MTGKRKSTNESGSSSALKKAYQGRFEDVSAAVLVVLAPKGRIVSVNGEAEELTGYERAELEQMCLPEIFREEDRPRIDSIFGSSAGLEFRKLFEHNVIVKKRSRRKIVVDMGFRRASAGSQGMADAFVFTLQDITDLKANEERVVRAHEYVESIIDSIIELLVVTDAKGVIESVNEAARGLLGYREDELVGRNATCLFPDLESPGAAAPLAETETQVLTKDGRRLPVLLSRSLLKSGASEGRAVLVAMDIRERKKAERLIAEQQMTIVQASKLSALGEMASSIAHEINNPLQVIIGRCELLEMQMESETPDLANLKAGLAMIEKMGQRINRIVRGLQAHARDQRHDQLETADLRGIIQETLSLCEQRIKIKVPDFKIIGPEAPTYLQCHPTQISQVLLNLLNNSYDEVSANAGAFIHVEWRVDGATLEISVTDSGKGIPKDVADRLFTPFFTTKPVGKGTGIGLSLSKSLIEAHKGTLELDRSCANTRFVIRLPMAAETVRNAS